MGVNCKVSCVVPIFYICGTLMNISVEMKWYTYSIVRIINDKTITDLKYKIVKHKHYRGKTQMAIYFGYSGKYQSGNFASSGTVCVAGAYTEIVIRGGPGVEVKVNFASAKGVSRYRPRGVWGHAPPGKFLKCLSQMVHYKSILKVIWEQKPHFCCSKILHSSVNLVYYLMVNPDI